MGLLHVASGGITVHVSPLSGLRRSQTHPDPGVPGLGVHQEQASPHFAMQGIPGTFVLSGRLGQVPALRPGTSIILDVLASGLPADGESCTTACECNQSAFSPGSAGMRLSLHSALGVLGAPGGWAVGGEGSVA